jgi:Replication factor-A protein 1, N-terminal domain
MDALTSNAIARINGMQNSEDDMSFQPTLQIINLRRVNKSNTTQERYRVSAAGMEWHHATLLVGTNFCVLTCHH